MSQKVSESDAAAAAAAPADDVTQYWTTPFLPANPYTEEKVSNASQPPQLVHQSHIPIDSIEQKTEYPKLSIKAFGWGFDGDGTILAIDYNEDDTIEEVKQKISDITGYEDREKMRIVSNGELLDGARTLKSYGIKEGQLIHLVRLGGLGGGRRRKKRKTKRRKTKKKSVKKRKKTKRRRKKARKKKTKRR